MSILSLKPLIEAVEHGQGRWHRNRRLTVLVDAASLNSLTPDRPAGIADMLWSVRHLNRRGLPKRVPPDSPRLHDPRQQIIMPKQVVKQRSRGFICVNAHPRGCERNVGVQIEEVAAMGHFGGDCGIRNVLVIGSSAGYGLATRIVTTWGLGCRTLGVFLEKPPAGRRTASAGYYNSVALHRFAEWEGKWVRSINGDAFSDDVKHEVSRVVASEMGKIDLVVYSLAAPKRSNPRTGTAHASSLRAIGDSYTGKTVDLATSQVTTATVAAATQQEIDDTVAVMGGEDWQWWIDRLLDDGLLAEGARTIAYSYYGPELTWPIYRDGTIGAAKAHLKETADLLHERLQNTVGGSAWLSVNAAVVTQASVAIPVVPLYMSILLRVMNQRGIHEVCIHQMHRLFFDQTRWPTEPDSEGNRLIRMDDLEMRDDVQTEVARLWPLVDTESLTDLTDFAYYKGEFNRLFGFDCDSVDYDLPVETEVFL